MVTIHNRTKYHSFTGLSKLSTLVPSLTISSTGTADMLGYALAIEALPSGTVGILGEGEMGFTPGAVGKVSDYIAKLHTFVECHKNIT